MPAADGSNLGQALSLLVTLAQSGGSESKPGKRKRMSAPSALDKLAIATELGLAQRCAVQQIASPAFAVIALRMHADGDGVAGALLSLKVHVKNWLLPFLLASLVRMHA